MRRDRDGSVIEIDEPELPLPAHHCIRGWRGEDPEGRPIPCYECRPELKARLARNRDLYPASRKRVNA